MNLLFEHEPPDDAPIVCDFTDAPDAPRQRLEEYGRLFQAGLISHQRTTTSVVLTFEPDLATWVTDLARREAACCPFMSYRVTDDGTSVRWETSATVEAQPILDEYHDLYQTVATATVDELIDQLAARGFDITTMASGQFEHRPTP